MAEERPVDFFVVGLGNPGAEYIMSRHNAGWIFVDYLANCVSMQSYLIENSNDEVVKALRNKEVGAATEIEAEKIVPSYQHPTFTRDYKLACDIHDVIFSLTAEDLAAIQGKDPASVASGTENEIVKTYRLILIKPLTVMQDCGLAVAAVLDQYKVKDPIKQLIVVMDDTSSLPGSILIQDKNDTKNVQNHEGILSIARALGSLNFIRFRLGIGKPSSPKTPLKNYVLGSFSKEDQIEMDMFGFALDLTAQALQHYACLGDIQKTKKRFSNIKKLPKTLRKMEGLAFPYKVEEINKPAETKKENGEKGEKKKEVASS